MDFMLVIIIAVVLFILYSEQKRLVKLERKNIDIHRELIFIRELLTKQAELITRLLNERKVEEQQEQESTPLNSVENFQSTEIKESSATVVDEPQTITPLDVTNTEPSFDSPKALDTSASYRYHPMSATNANDMVVKDSCVESSKEATADTIVLDNAAQETLIHEELTQQTLTTEQEYFTAQSKENCWKSVVKKEAKKPTVTKSFFYTMLAKLVTSFKENWLIWVGSFAMLIGVGYLVQVISSHIEVSPVGRITSLLIASLLVLLGGEWFHRKEQQHPERKKRASNFTYVPAVITSTGLTGIYCTVLYAFVVYQLLSPTWSFGFLALAATLSLFLSLRQGPLMAALGLIGGYSAPLWITAAEPNFFLLMGYISIISAAATLVMQRGKFIWITPVVSVAHLSWMLIILNTISMTQGFSWLAIFMPITVYLLYAVPRLGWQLTLRYRHHQKHWSHAPVVIASAISLLLLSFLIKSVSLSPIQIMMVFAMLALLVWLPALRSGFSVRLYYFATLVSAISGFIFVFAALTSYAGIGQYSLVSFKSLLYCVDACSTALLESSLYSFACLSVFIAIRTIFQYQFGDRSKFAFYMVLALVPAMTLITLFSLYQLAPEYLTGWSIFTVIMIGLYGYFAWRISTLSQFFSTSAHLMLVALSFAWFDNVLLTTAIALQIAIMVLQIQYRKLPPIDWAIKAAMIVLSLRLTLLPFVPEWQPTHIDSWAWGISSYLPALLILGYARMVLNKLNSEMTNWFEGALLHLFLMALFTQTNYWLTGSYGYITSLDFVSAAVFANQTIIMALVYYYRSQFANVLKSIYQGYSYLLLAIFTILTFVLNTAESPLLVDNVSVQAWPIFNMLTLGWLLPAIALFVAYRLPFTVPSISRYTYLAVGGVLAGLWLGMSIRQFWQPLSMTLAQPTGMAELFSYSIAGLIVGALLTWKGVMDRIIYVQRTGLILLSCVVLKVFLWDVSSLDGFWRAISFLGLGVSLVTLGWLFQKFNRSIVSSH